MNPKDCVWENLYQIIMKTTFQGKKKQFTTALQFGSQIYSHASSHKIPVAKAVVDKEWKNWRNFRRGPCQKSEAKRGDP